MTGGLLTFGETMGLIRTQDIGTLDVAREARIGIGGAESNVAIGVARLGGPATWIGRIGRDALGDLVRYRLQAAGVRTLAIEDDACTGVMLRHTRAGSTVQVDYHRAGSAGARLHPGDVPAEVLTRADLLHVTGITPALSRSAQDTFEHAVRTASAAGVTVSLDVNYRRKLWRPEPARAALQPLLRYVDILFAGVEEAQLLLSSNAFEPGELASALADQGPTEVVIKDGANGCAALVDRVQHQVAAPRVGVIDPVGAGDAFVAGYLAERLAGAEPAQGLRTAVAAGSYAVTVPGDCELLPTRAELAGLLSTTDVVR
jgi:2-dehydro-3-deoxygluconokinase